MQGPFAAIAMLHQRSNPRDPRSLAEIEMHYRGLATSSPLAQVFQAIATDDVSEAQIVRDRHEMTCHAQDCVEAWKSSGTIPYDRADLVEYLHSQLESNFPEFDPDLAFGVAEFVANQKMPG